jgi:hypothetical protein
MQGWMQRETTQLTLVTRVDAFHHGTGPRPDAPEEVLVLMFQVCSIPAEES